MWRMKENVLGLASASADLGEKQVNTKGGVLVDEEALELGDLLAQHLWGVADASDDTEAASVGDCGGELGAGSHVHAGEQNGVLDLEQIGDGGSELLCMTRVSVSDCLRIIGERMRFRGNDVRGEAMMSRLATEVL
jgi:hypothetical protein